MNDFETAKAALAHALKDPSAFSAEDINAFADIVENGQPAPRYAPGNPMGEAASISSLGPERSVESNVPVQDAPIEQSSLAGGHQEDYYNAFGPKRKDEPPSAQDGDYSPGGIKARSAHDEWFASLHDTTLPSASKMRDIYRPPSRIAKSPEMAPGVSGLDAIRQAANYIESAKSTAMADHFFEPSVDQFRRDMYPVLGPHVMNMGEESEQYKQYADMQWKQAHDKAEAENKTAIRHSFATEGNGMVNKMLHGAAHEGLAFFGSAPVLGKAAARLTGGDEAVQNLENVTSQSPLTSMAGSLMTGAKLFAPLDAALPGASSGLGRVGRAGGIGAAFGAGSTAADEALGSHPTSASRIAQDAGMAGLLGLGAGTTFGAMGELPRAYRSKVINTPELQSARAGGAETDWRQGIKPTPGGDIERIQRETAAGGYPADRDLDLAISQSRKPISAAAAKEGALAQLEHGKAEAEYEGLTENHRQAVTELFDVATKGRAGQVGPEGRSLAVGPEESNIRKIQNTVATVKPLREHYEVAKVLGPDEDGMLAQAKAMYGEDVEAKIARAKVKKAHLAEFADWGTNPPVDAHGATEPSGGVDRGANTSPGGKAHATNNIHDTLEDPITNLDTLSPETPPGAEMWSEGTPEGPQRTSKIMAELYGIKRLADAELMPAKTARANGIEVPAGVADDQLLLLKNSKKAPLGGKLMDAHEAKSQGFDVPKDVAGFEKVIIAPRKMNPGELKATIDSIDTLQKAGKNVPKINELQRAARQIRDRFPDIGPFEGARANLPDVTREPLRGTSNFEGAGKLANSVADESGTKEDLLRFLNQDRRRVSEGERAGTPSPLSESVTRFLRAAEQKGATYEGPTYRGISAGELEAFRTKGESTHTWSVSKAREGADHFGKGGAVLEIRGGAVPVDGIEGSNTFDEALVPKGTPFNVKGERTENGVRVITVERAQGKQLTGLSAAQHNYSEASGARELRNQRTGILPEGKADEAQTYQNSRMTAEKAGTPIEVTKAHRELADNAGARKAYDFVDQLMAYKKLRGEKLDPAVIARLGTGRLPLQGRTTMNVLNLHLDPILAGRYLPNAGALGGAAGYSAKRKYDQLHPDFDTINQLLNPMGP